jgi:hypothetical protein
MRQTGLPGMLVSIFRRPNRPDFGQWTSALVHPIPSNPVRS